MNNSGGDFFTMNSNFNNETILMLFYILSALGAAFYVLTHGDDSEEALPINMTIIFVPFLNTFFALGLFITSYFWLRAKMAKEL